MRARYEVLKGVWYSSNHTHRVPSGRNGREVSDKAPEVRGGANKEFLGARGLGKLRTAVIFFGVRPHAVLVYHLAQCFSRVVCKVAAFGIYRKTSSKEMSGLHRGATNVVDRSKKIWLCRLGSTTMTST